MATVHCNVDPVPDCEWPEIAARMRPGGISIYGMLSPDENPSNIIDEDHKTMQRLGITNRQLATAMAYVSDACWGTKEPSSGVSCSISVYPGSAMKSIAYRAKPQGASAWYLLTTCCYNGAQGCPFQNNRLDRTYHGYAYGSCDVRIIDNGRGQQLQFSTLLIHMIAAHGFFEGRSIRDCEQKPCANPWRVDPKHAYTVLREIVDKVPPEGDAAALARYTSH